MAKYNLLFSLLVLVFSLNLKATTFIPLSVKQQLRDASGVIRGVYQGSTYKKMRGDRVITEASFKISTMSGLKNHEVINKNNFKVIFPGGKWQGVNYQISGSPTFKKNEEVVLLLTKTSNGFAVTNLALGKYTIKKEFGKEYLSSALFPNHKNLRSIPLAQFNSYVKDYFGSGMINIDPDKFVYKGISKERKQKTKGRRPASTEEEATETERENSIVWLVILFAFLGFYSAYTTKQRNK
ncbi:MAG: hypothetical protein HN576_02215 [Bacteriovoracaceae bacterium]|jgi:hypothetical protein|nr:hypothetical protein [Bacteriovoracaceae bacterium]